MEWLAVCAIVVALVGLVASTGPAIAEGIVSTARAAICAVSGTSCKSSGDSPASGGAPRAGSPGSGPAIGGGLPIFSVPGLGEGGSVSVNDGGGPFKVTFERGNSACTIDGSGKPSVTLSASIDFNLTAKDGEIKKGNGAEVSLSLGKKTTYDVQTDPINGRAIERGERPAPNPADPRSIPPGSSITLNKDSYRGVTGKVAYRNIQAELGYTATHRVSSGVQRIDSDHVRITIGDSDLVDNTVGVSAGGRVGFRFGQGFENGKARSVDIDISTPAGRKAYGAFIQTGHLPAAGATGTSDPTTSVATTSTSTGQAQIDLGKAGINAGGSQVEYQNVETTHADGTKERNVFIRNGDMVTSTHYDLASDGAITGQSFAIHVQDVDPDFINGLQQATGHHGDASEPRDVSLTFSPSEISGLQDAALDQLLASQRGHDGPFANGGTREQMRAYLAAHPDGAGLRGTAIALEPLIAIAGAKVPDDVLRALVAKAHGSGERLLEELAIFARDTAAARHQLGMADPDTPLAMGYWNRPKGC